MTIGDVPPLSKRELEALPRSWAEHPFDTAGAFGHTGPGIADHIEEVRVIPATEKARRPSDDLEDIELGPELTWGQKQERDTLHRAHDQAKKVLSHAELAIDALRVMHQSEHADILAKARALVDEIEGLQRGLERRDIREGR